MQSIYYRQGYTEEEATASARRRESEVHPEGKVHLRGDGVNCWSSASRGPFLCWEVWGEKKNFLPFQMWPGKRAGAEATGEE